MSDRLTIGQVAERSGLPVKTIRFYEEQGIVPPPERSSGGFRLYAPIDVRRLKLVRLAKLAERPPAARCSAVRSRP